MLMNRDAVSVCHVKTENMHEINKTADILFSATDVQELVKDYGKKRCNCY